MVAASLLLGQGAIAQQDFSNVEIQTDDLGNGIYMLTGEGGNIGLSVGDDGVFMIDDQFAPLSDKINAAIDAITDQDVTYLLNTHWHFDHTGGNENFGQAGAVIVAHENVRERMSTKQLIKAFGRVVPASPEAALPVITFTEDATFHFNGHELQIQHLANAHTDGDSSVYFADANVIHTGDTFFNGFFPFIDGSSNGSIEGMIAAGEQILSVVDADTTIIPGHGPLADKADLEAFLEMLAEVQSTMEPLVAGDASREEVIADNPLSNLDEQWGGGFLNTETFTGIAYDLMAAK